MKKSNGLQFVQALRMLRLINRFKLGIASFAQLASTLFDLFGIVTLGIIGNHLVSKPTSDIRESTFLSRISFLDEISQDFIIVGLLVLTIISFSIKNVIFLLSNYYILRVLSEEQIRLTNKATDQILKLPYAQFRTKDPQHLSYTVNDGIAALLMGFLYPSVNLMAELLFLLLIFITLCIVNLPVTVLVALYFGILTYLVTSRLSKTISQLSRRSLDSNLEFRTKLISTLSVVREIRTLGKAAEFLNDLNVLKVRVVKSNAKVTYLGLLPKTILDSGFLFGALLIFLALEYYSGGESPASILLTYFAAASRLIPSLMRIQNSLFTRRYSAPAAERGYELLELIHSRTDIFESPEFGNENEYLPLISLRDVSFYYPDDQIRPTLRDISLDIYQGDRITLVGKSGSGKSTLVDILLGIAVPTVGTATIESQDISTWIHRNPGAIAYQPQEISLIKGTIRENICLGERKISEKHLQSALNSSGFQEVVAKLPLGLDTEVSDFLSKMSGGEKQRLVLARTLYTNPRIVILDEATSNLDVSVERHVLNALKNLKHDVTVIQISHKLFTLAESERLVYISEGKILAVGTYLEIYSTSEDFRNYLNSGSEVQE